MFLSSPTPLFSHVRLDRETFVKSSVQTLTTYLSVANITTGSHTLEVGVLICYLGFLLAIYLIFVPFSSAVFFDQVIFKQLGQGTISSLVNPTL